MKRIVRLTESDLTRIVRRVISEAEAATVPRPGGGIDYLVQTRFIKNPTGASVLAVTSRTWKGSTVTCTGNLFVRNPHGQYVNEGSDTWTVSTTGRAKPNSFYDDNQQFVSATNGQLLKDVHSKFPITKQNNTEYFAFP